MDLSFNINFFDVLIHISKFSQLFFRLRVTTYMPYPLFFPSVLKDFKEKKNEETLMENLMSNIFKHQSDCSSRKTTFFQTTLVFLCYRRMCLIVAYEVKPDVFHSRRNFRSRNEFIT